MSLKERLYNLLPAPLQNAACTLEGRRIAARRYAPGFFRTFEAIRFRDRLDPEETRKLQTERLRAAMKEAYRRSPYYRRLFDEAGYDPAAADLQTIARLPILKKSTVVERLDEIVNAPRPGEERFVASTSGTTGRGLRFPMTRECEWETWAVWWRYRHNHGITFDTWCAVFGSRSVVPLRRNSPPYYRVAAPLRQYLFSMHHLNERSVAHYVEAFNRHRIPWIHGHPSTIANFAALMLEKGLRFDYPLRFLTTGSENLLEHQSELMRRAFGVAPVQHYGLTEPVANISMCEHGRLHIDEDYALVELIPVEGLPGRYRVVGTSFSNDAMLFLRYDTNDVVTLAEKQSCPCGRRSRIVEAIDGREEDYVVTKEGTRIGRLSTIFKELSHIKEAQIHQRADGKVLFRIVRSEGYGPDDERRLREEIEKRLHIDYAIDYVVSIPKTKGGKLKFVTSDYQGKRT